MWYRTLTNFQRRLKSLSAVHEGCCLYFLISLSNYNLIGTDILNHINLTWTVFHLIYPFHPSCMETTHSVESRDRWSIWIRFIMHLTGFLGFQYGMMSECATQELVACLCAGLELWITCCGWIPDWYIIQMNFILYTERKHLLLKGLISILV